KNHYLAARSPVGRFVDWQVIVEQSPLTLTIMTRRILVGTILFALLSAFVVFYLLSRVIRISISPVETLSHTVSEIARTGDLDHKIELSESHTFKISSEIGILIHSFNNMMEGLRTAQEGLKNINEELEQRVMERTVALDSSNKELHDHRQHLEELVKERTAKLEAEIIERKAIEARLEISLKKLRTALGGIVRITAMTVEARDPYTAGHQRRVADLARSIGQEMGLSENQVEGLRMVGVIHDLGKIAVPAEILSKPTKLTTIEFELIKTHPQTGFDILKDIEFPWPIARMVLEHHERINGSGYPNGLKGNALLWESKILMVADVVEAIASHRPYRPAHGIGAALEEIEKNRGVLYESDVVDSCLRLFREKGYQFMV
ncbi:MAG: HD domain-containing phosphohydrolase, partial [Thermodesulfobacteriota bacterium]